MERIDQIIQHPVYQYHMGRIEEAEQSRIFCRHGLEHALDVARIMYIKALEQHISYQKDLIYAAALLHDIGRFEQYEKQLPHHEAGALIAAGILAECQYTGEEITQITDAIRSHRKADSGEMSVLNKLLYDADKLSRNCFACRAQQECYWESSKRNRTIRY